MLFWCLMYLYSRFIRLSRCFFDSHCICTALIFSIADALFGDNVSATCFSLNLQMLFILPIMYNCIYILLFLGFEDASFANFASTSHVFDNVRILPNKILHLQPVLSMTCRYSQSKFCIFNPRKSTIADIVAQYPLRSLTSWTEPIHDLQKN